MKFRYLLQRNTIQASRKLVYKPLHFHALEAVPDFQYHQFVRITEKWRENSRRIISIPNN